MKIIFHLNSMGRGGAEHVVSILSHKLAQAGHDVTITTQWYSENEYEIDPKVKRVHVGLTEADENSGRIKKAFSRLFRLRDFIKKENPDLVISFCSKANFRSAFSLFGMNTPLIVSVRNNPVEDYKGHFMSTKYMEKKAAGCVFQTPDAMKFFSESFQKKSVIVFNPIAEEYLDVRSEREKNPVTRNKVIVNVGRITKQKNQLLLLKAFKKIAGDYPDHILRIYGDTQETSIFNELNAYLKENNLSDRVSFMGTAKSMKDEISDAAMFVLSSDFEGMPNSLIEAIALGIPSISTDCPCGGSRMLIDDHKSGILVPIKNEAALAEAMDSLLKDSAFAESLGSNALSVIDKVHPDKICKDWEEYISGIVRI
jgi:glycosyltransferase involved in cell wall biosynthesis